VSEQTTVSPSLLDARRRAPLNFLVNGAWLVVNAGINMWYVPFLIGHLGVAVYGLVPLTTSLTKYMALLTDGINSAISRYLTVDLAQGNFEKSNQTFNTAVVGLGLISFILLPFVFLVSFFAPHLFTIPTGLDRDAQIIVLLILLAFMVNIFASSFAVPSFTYHRFDLRFLINTSRLMAEVGCVIFIFNVVKPSLWHVGIATLVGAVILLGGYLLVWRKLTPNLQLNWRFFSSRSLRDMVGFSGWVLVNQVGSLLFLNVDLLIVNRMFGVEAGGLYGAVIVFPVLLRSLAATLNTVLVPVIISLYAQEKYETLVKISEYAVKWMGLVMALPVGLLCGLSRPLLTLWLGEEFAHLSWLVVALCAHLTVNTAVIPLFSLQIATNRVRLPALVAFFGGVGNVFLAIAFSLWGRWEYVGIAIAGAIVLTLKNAFFTTLYGANILNLRSLFFVRHLVPGTLMMICIGSLTYLINQQIPINDWMSFFSWIAFVSIIYIPLIYMLGLNKDDRKALYKELLHRMEHVA
jgi:O-antigen/teichoic acid export membrane protein